MEKREQKARLERIFRGIEGIDAVVIVNTASTDPTFLYLTGFAGGLDSYESAVLVATRNRIFLMISPVEYQTAMEQKTELMQVVDNRYGGDAAVKLLTRLIRGRKVGINASFLPVKVCDNLKARYSPKAVVDISGSLVEARLVKDGDEIRRIRDAVKVTKTAMLEISKHFKEGVTEQQIAARFDFIQMSLGATEVSFRTIVCFGKNCAIPHHVSDDTKLRKGDLVLIDAGSRVEGYCSDITRMFSFKKASKEQTDMLETVREAQTRAIAAVKAGEKGNAIYNIANDFINNAHNGRYRNRFIHKLGHSLGLEVHDGGAGAGAFGLYKEENILKEGMVITVEPGIYVPGFGGARIEDDILVTKKGHVIL